MLLLLFIGIGIITPIVEEIVFRGFALRAVDRRFGLAPAIVATSVVFGVFHAGALSLDDAWMVALLTCYGVVFATLAVVNRGRIGASIVCHMLNNSVVFAVVML
jgi:membrane protease YdiL (CAAX protease family)